MSDQPFKIDVSQRISRLPPYLFGRINKMKYEMRVAGVDIIDLGMGNPTDPTPDCVVKKLAEASRDPRNHRYSVSNGIAGLRKEVSKKYRQKYGVELDAETEVIATIGSKEGFSHLCLAMLGPGDTAVVGDPAFPIHVYAVAMAGANVIRVPLGNDQGVLDRIERTIDGPVSAAQAADPQLPAQPDGDDDRAGVLGPRDRPVQTSRDHDHLRLSPTARSASTATRRPSFPRRRRRQGDRRRVHDHVQELQHGRLALRVLLRQRGHDQGAGDDQGYYDYGMFAPIQIASVIAMRECKADGRGAEQDLRAAARRRLRRPG
jgi:alanine-synthesizing transaminase